MEAQLPIDVSVKVSFGWLVLVTALAVRKHQPPSLFQHTSYCSYLPQKPSARLNTIPLAGKSMCSGALYSFILLSNWLIGHLVYSNTNSLLNLNLCLNQGPLIYASVKPDRLQHLHGDRMITSTGSGPDTQVVVFFMLEEARELQM